MNEHKYIVRLLGFFISAAALVVFIIAYVDPFQVYHKPLLAGMPLNENQRYQNVGLINSYLLDPAAGYEALAFGTSMSANYTGADLEGLLGWGKTLRLFLNGGSAAEVRETIELALKKRKVKHLLLELNLWSMKETGDAGQQRAFPHYLYNANRWDDVLYFADLVVLMESVKAVVGLNESGHGTPDSLGYWADRHWVKEVHAQFNKTAFKQALVSNRVHLLPLTEKRISTFNNAALQNDVAPLLRQLCNQDMEVVLFISPYSALSYQINDTVDYLVIYQLRHILKMIDGCSNIRLHAFDLLDFTNNLNNYKDRRHHMPNVNNQILRWIHNREHIVDLNAIPDYEKRWMHKINTQKIYSSYPAELDINL